MKKTLLWLLAAWTVLASMNSRAEPVELTLPSKQVAKAEFRAGNPAKPAVILIHGFLQTHNFPIINRLLEALSAEGYTVLAPTLSLGITHRAQSLACEAIHTHTVASGAAEIHAWVKWLKARKAKKTILVGHSLGNVHNLEYLSSHPDASVSKFIGISIMEGRLKAGEQTRSSQIQKLRKSMGTRSSGLLEEQFSFCQKFRASPESLLSYMEWGPDKILETIDTIRIPVTMIMGSQDDRLGEGWLDRLKKSRARVVIIDGANHFMDGQYEFDLLDHFLEELRRA